jgi:hypothetical protein
MKRSRCFCYQVKKEIGFCAAAWADKLVFAGASEDNAPWSGVICTGEEYLIAKMVCRISTMAEKRRIGP